MSASISASISASVSLSEFESVPLTVESESTTELKQDETPLGAGPDLDKGINPWWSWIPVIGGAIGIWDGLKKKKEDEVDEETDENESDNE